MIGDVEEKRDVSVILRNIVCFVFISCTKRRPFRGVASSNDEKSVKRVDERRKTRIIHAKEEKKKIIIINKKKKYGQL